MKLYIAKHRIDGSSYPTLASSLVVETLLDFVVAAILFLAAIQLGLLPGLPDLPRLPAFDWTFVVEHPRAAVFIWCVLLTGLICSSPGRRRHVTAFRQKLASASRSCTTGAPICGRSPRGRPGAGWHGSPRRSSSCARSTSTRRSKTTLAVLVVSGLSTLPPFTPGGAGTQAILVFALAGRGELDDPRVPASASSS